MCYELEIVPRDVMFFRDARPIGGSHEGSGNAWPLPSALHSAVLTMLTNKLGDRVSEWESEHTKLKEKEKNKTSKFKFGGLKTFGPFPKCACGKIYVPTPADLIPLKDEKEYDCDSKCPACRPEKFSGKTAIMSPMKLKDVCSNLPKPLIYPVGSMGEPSKDKLGEWISLDELEKYLRGDVDEIKTVSSSELYSSELRPGIEISAETGTVEEGKFYSAEYLRLKGSSMVAFAECEARKYNAVEGKDVFEEVFRNSGRSGFTFGGQRGVAWMDCKRMKKDNCNTPLSLPLADLRGKDFGAPVRIKWILLTPAYFKDGWLPGILEDGKIALKQIPPRGNMTRAEWRKSINESDKKIEGKLVAARIAKPLAVSGWKLNPDADAAGGEPKATRLYVPAGSVYYFECPDRANAEALVKVLHGQAKSGLLGEQGFGLGVCSEWQLNEIHYKNNK